MAWVLSRQYFVAPIRGATRIEHLDDLPGTFARPVALATVDPLFPPKETAGPRYAAAAQARVNTNEWEDE